MNGALAAWLHCPRCEAPLSEVAPLELGCTNGHRFDRNKRGYLNLLPDHRGKSLGDSRAMLEARATFLATGLYEPIAKAVATAIPASATRVVDAGCGTGYYLAQLVSAREVDALALDASTEAVAMAVRAVGCPGLVADTWAALPIRDGAADAIMCIFSPRNPAEFVRILALGGVLVTVTPSARHLAELRDSGQLIGMQEDKLDRLDEALLHRFELGDRSRLDYRAELSAAQVDAITAMGPTGHHEQRAAAASGVTATVSVDVSVYRRR